MKNLFEKLEEIKNLLPETVEEEVEEEVTEEITTEEAEEKDLEDEKIFEYLENYIIKKSKLIEEKHLITLCITEKKYTYNNHSVVISTETAQYMGGNSIEIDGEYFYYYDTNDGGFFPSWYDGPSATIIKNKKIIKNIIDLIFNSDKNFDPDEIREKFNLI